MTGMAAHPPASKKPRRDEAGEHGTESVYEDTNGVPRAEGRMTHIGLADGELANRVVVVGHPSRAELLAGFLEPEEPGRPLFRLASDRGFLTYTGLFQGQRVSVVSIGMGLVMVDFFLREARSTVEGPMAVVRLGTCGVLPRAVEVGTISVATKGSILVQRNYAADFGAESSSSTATNGAVATNGAAATKRAPYDITEPCSADAALSDAVVEALREELGASAVIPGLNATADSFFSSQGRRDPWFPDQNEGLLKEVLARYPDIVSMEMESFMLLHLARCCQPHGSIRAAAAHVNVANRSTGAVVGGDLLKKMEREGGKAILKALAGLTL